MWTPALSDASMLIVHSFQVWSIILKNQKNPPVTGIWIVKKEKTDLQFSVVTLNCSYTKR